MPSFVFAAGIVDKLKFGVSGANVKNIIRKYHMMDKSSLALKFRGCMVGALAGDCLGEPFEQDDWDELPNESQLDDYIQDLVNSKVKGLYNCI